jgi:muramoyltetrapeptide carboxypeptidase LdcA involved in peptidoglycan recycling
MLNLIKPSALKAGDTIATVSLSWGGAGDEGIKWRYEQGRERLESLFGLKVVEMPHTLSGTEYVRDHPEDRATDIMAAFKNPEIRAIFACIGGTDSIRMLPYIDFDVIRNNPKIFMGFSDTTVTHFICMKAGISSFYGPAVLTDFAENLRMFDYTVNSVFKTLFETEPIGAVSPSDTWTSEFLAWEISNKNIARKTAPNGGYELLQGAGKVSGRLIGGCLDVISKLCGTPIFPEVSRFDGAILFLECSENDVPASVLEDWLRWFNAAGITERISGIIFGRPVSEKSYTAYKPAIGRILAEAGKPGLPVLYNLNFGHASPLMCLPYGALAEIDCERMTFSILESGVK